MTAPMLFLLCAAVLLVGTALITAVLIRRGERPRRDRRRAARLAAETLAAAPVSGEAGAAVQGSAPDDTNRAPLPAPVEAPAAAPVEQPAVKGGDNDRLRNVLLSRMSHDLRSPLNSVITLSQLLNDGNAGPLSAEQRSYVEVIQRNGRTLLALINDILDIAAGDAERDNGDGTPAPETGEALSPPAGAVLLVEDDDTERQRVGGLLERAGFTVTPAGSGEEGLALLRTRRFDAVVLDLVMPGLTGLDVLRAARVEERLADVPFIVLSALYMTKTERAVLGPGVVSVVRKGDVTADELTLALRRAIHPAADQHAGGERHA
jgi:CheY-like chemotaxis protein